MNLRLLEDIWNCTIVLFQIHIHEPRLHLFLHVFILYINVSDFTKNPNGFQKNHFGQVWDPESISKFLAMCEKICALSSVAEDKN